MTAPNLYRVTTTALAALGYPTLEAFTDAVEWPPRGMAALVRWLTLTVALFAVTGCSGSPTPTASARTHAPTPSPTEVLSQRPLSMSQISMPGFTLALPNDYFTESPSGQDGVQKFPFSGPAVTGLVEVIPLSDRTMPPGVGDLLHDSMTTVAARMNGTRPGTTDVQITEALHGVTVNGADCARFGFSSAYQGANGVTVVLTCRHATTIYVVSLDDLSLRAVRPDDRMSQMMDGLQARISWGSLG